MLRSADSAATQCGQGPGNSASSEGLEALRRFYPRGPTPPAFRGIVGHWQSWPVFREMSNAVHRSLLASKPLSNSAMIRACPSTVLAEAVTAVAALGGSPLRRCRAILGTLYCFSLAVNIRAVVGAFRLRLLLLLRRRLRGRWLRSLREQRSEQDSHERNHGLEPTHKAHFLSRSLG